MRRKVALAAALAACAFATSSLAAWEPSKPVEIDGKEKWLADLPEAKAA